MDEQVSRSLIWLELSNDEIKEAVNSGRLLSLFTIDYLKYCGDIICLNCEGWEIKLNLFKTKIINAMSNKSEYRLKAKYNGINGVSNDSITDSQAKKLIKEHPKGEGLFISIPVKKTKVEDVTD